MKRTIILLIAIVAMLLSVCPTEAYKNCRCGRWFIFLGRYLAQIFGNTL